MNLSVQVFICYMANLLIKIQSLYFILEKETLYLNE